MRTVDFGFGTQYDDGTQTSVAVNAANVVLEVHKSENEDTLWCRVGNIGRATIAWGKSVRYDSGESPACALNGLGKAVEVHRSQNDSGLWYRVGSVAGGAASWGQARKYDSGSSPAVALNDAGLVVEVHKSQNEDTLWYRTGTLSGDKVGFGGSQKYDSGISPSVALNRAGVVVEVHQSQNEGTLWYRVGTAAGGKISFGPSRKYDNGESPSVAVADDGRVVEVHKSQSEDTLWSRSGVVSGDSISWSASSRYDDGRSPSVGCNGRWAVQTHRSGSASTLWASAALLMDRARWMAEHRDALGARTLREVAIPGSHDAGMYRGDFLSGYGQTQDTGLYGQLSHGSRYFDLRPEWKDGKAVMHHGSTIDMGVVSDAAELVGVDTSVDIEGPPLSEVLDDVKRFMTEVGGELVILKFSHFSGFDGGSYARLADQVHQALEPWLFVTASEGGRRLADVPLGELLGGAGKVAVMMDSAWFHDNPTPGILVYRDENKCDAAIGDLRVFDHYSATATYSEMKSKQLEKFAGYTGDCVPKSDCDVPAERCDLFLLSWTLTPDDWDYVTYDMADVMRTANRNLAAGIQEAVVPNGHGRAINVVFLDYVEYARAVEVCLSLNGLL
jgi:hypothetical protein